MNETMRDPPKDEVATVPSPEADGGSPGQGIHAELSADEVTQLTDDIVGAIKTVYDPEIPADIYELGLIYKIEIGADRKIDIEMTLTTPNCPSAQELPLMVENAVAGVPGVGEVQVQIVWDPPWEPSRMSDEARVVLNMW